MSLLGTAGGSVGLALSAYGSSMQSQAKSEAAISNMEAAINVRNTQATIFEQQNKEIQERLGQQLSQEDLKTLESEARRRAAMAESGTSGGTSNLAVNQAYVIGSRNREIITLSAKDKQLSLARKNLTSRLDAENAIARYENDIPTAEEIWFNGIGSSIQGFASGYNSGSNLESAYSNQEETKTLQQQNEQLKEKDDLLSKYKSTLERNI